jgi:hypothetical protein
MLYLFKNPNALKIWDDGWKYNRRPNLQSMAEYLNRELLQGGLHTTEGFPHDLNGAAQTLG